RIENQVSQLNLQFEIIIIGGHRERIEHVIKILRKMEKFKNKITSTGYTNQVGISIALKSCSLGITPVPIHALGKSGSVAAFIEHGLPVAAPNIHPAFSPEEIGFFSSNLSSSILRSPEIHAINNAQKYVMEAKQEISVSTIARKF